MLGGIPILRARTCCITERVRVRVRVSGHINERDHSEDIHIVKVNCWTLLDTVTRTVTKWTRTVTT